MATRDTYSSASAPPVNGPAFADNLAGHIKRLYDASYLPLTSVGGTGNAVTAALDPVLDGGGLVTGMKFGITWAATNSGGMTLAINGGSAVPVLQANGAAMTGGAAPAGQRTLLEYVGGAFLVIGGGAGGGSTAAPYMLTITTSQTWTKPSGYDDDALVIIEAWGAGASGERQTSVTDAKGGVGGGYAVQVMSYADVPSSLSVVIGAGGAPKATGVGSNPGGDTIVGSILTAPGGGTSAVPAAGMLVTPTGTQMTLHSGAHGGDAAGRSGYAAVFGGAGGAAYSGPSGGISKYGGNGGTAPSSHNVPGGAGQAPGGGGGASYGSSAVSGAGARGEVRIRIIG